MKNVLVIAALLAAFGIACAQPVWPIDVAVREGQNLRDEVTTIPEASGGVIVIRVEQARGENCLMAAKYGAAGETIWQEPLLVKGGTDLKTNLRAAKTTDGGTVLSWIEDNNGFTYKLRIQKLSAAGSILWDADGVVVCLCFGNPPDYMLSPDQAGGAYLFVNPEPSASAPSHAYAYRLNNAGADVWGTNQPSVSENGYLDMESIATTPGGDGFVVAYRRVQTTNQSRVFRYFTSAGASDWNISESGTSADDGAIQLLANSAQKVNVFRKTLPNSTGINVRTINIATGAWIASEASMILFNSIPSNNNMGFSVSWMPESSQVSLIVWYELGEQNHIEQAILSDQMQLLQTRTVYATNDRIADLKACDDGNLRTFLVWLESPAGSIAGTLKGQAVGNATGYLLYPSSGLTISPNLTNSTRFGMSAANGKLQAFYAEPGEDTSTLKHRAFDGAGNSLLTPQQEDISTFLKGYAWPWRCMDIAGYAVNIYQDTRKAGENRLYYQINDASGSAMFPPEGVLIASGDVANAFFYDAIPCGNDRFAVLYRNNGLYLQVWNIDGTTQYAGQGLQISPDQVARARMALCDGDIYICWSHAGSSTGNRIAGQRISAGLPAWGPDGITIADNVVYFRGIGAPVGRFFIWSNRYSSTSISEVVAKRVDAGGNTLPGWAADGNVVFQVSTADMVNPEYTALHGDDLLMFAGYAASQDVYAQRVNASGELPWGLDGVLIHAVPHLVLGAYVDDRGIVIGFRLNSDGITGMYLQGVKPDGNLMYPAPGMILDGGDLNSASSFAFGRYSNGGLLAVWSAGYDPNLDYTELWYRNFSPSGQAQETAPQLLCSAPFSQMVPKVSNPSSETLYVSWADARAGMPETGLYAYGVHLQKLAYSGSPNPDEPQAPAALMLKPCQPNPFSESTRVSWTQKDCHPTQCSIYNIRGQLVKRFPPSAARAGEHSLIWNGEDHLNRQTAPGIYIVKVSCGGQSANCKVLKAY